MKPVALANITKSNLISQVWQNVYDILNSNLTDPKSRSKWIYAAFPSVRKGTADTYPCIIIESPDMSGENIIMGHSSRSYRWSIPISVYSTRMEDVDTIADDIINTLETNKGSLSTNNLYQFNVDSTPVMHTVIASQIVHEKRILVTVESVV